MTASALHARQKHQARSEGMGGVERVQKNVDEGLLEEILADPESKEYQDLRNRAAYIYITGSYPTHLRSFFTSLLRMATRYARGATSLDQRTGRFHVSDEVAQRLDLESHPMVAKVREYVNSGYKIQIERALRARRPFGRVFLYLVNEYGRIRDRVTVQYDGSIKEGWD